MSRLDDLERELFRAGADEEPGPALRQRIHQQLAVRDTREQMPGATVVPRSAAAVVGFWGVAALAALALLMLADPHDDERATTVKAERLRPLAAVPPRARQEEPPVVEPKLVASAERAQPERRPERRSRSLAEQLEVLGQARAALRAGNGARALALLDEYTKRKNSVDMNAEAMLLRIEALQALGRHGQAGALAQQLITRYPDTPLADRARSLVRGSGSGHGDGAGE